MKVAFSYKNQNFMPLLVGSIVVHGLILGASGVLSSKPEYGVVQAPSSVEVILLEKPKIKSVEQVDTDHVLTTEESPVVTKKVPEAEPLDPKKETKNEETVDSVITPPRAGAISEAEPDYLQNPTPLYPRIARRRGWEGTVYLRVFVDREGRAAQVLLDQSSGHQILDRSALKTVRGWKFRPARAGRLVFETWIRIPVRFILE